MTTETLNLTEPSRKRPSRKCFLKTVVGALQDTINQHGPIDEAILGSAAKRIVGQLIASHGELFPSGRLPSAEKRAMRKTRGDAIRGRNEANAKTKELEAEIKRLWRLLRLAGGEECRACHGDPYLQPCKECERM